MPIKSDLRGSMVALVTPFRGDQVDEAKLGELIDWHIASKTDALVVVGTTGESPTLSEEEKFRIIRLTKKRVRGRLPVVAGSGTNCTDKTIEHSRMAEKAGADALLVVAPYYNKPSQEGLYRHYQAVARAVDLPIVVYNVPGRTSVNIAPETMARIAQLKNVVAVKEASGSIEQVIQIRTLCDIDIISGDDALTFPIMTLGGVGVISVAANIVPVEIAEMCRLLLKSRHNAAQKLHNKHYTLFKTLFIESNPVPVKTALEMMGRAPAKCRLPLCEMSGANREKLRECLRSYGLVR